MDFLEDFFFSPIGQACKAEYLGTVGSVCFLDHTCHVDLRGSGKFKSCDNISLFSLFCRTLCGWIQIDNQLFAVAFPGVLFPVPPPKTVALQTGELSGHEHFRLYPNCALLLFVF